MRLKALAVEHSHYGYLLLDGLLKAEGLVINKKWTYQIYIEQGLQMPTKKRKKLQPPRLPIVLPAKAIERRSMDFFSDQLSHGRRFRVPNIVDDFTGEMVGQRVAVSITGNQVARYLNQLGEKRPLPPVITCDNGTEFTSKGMFCWAKENKVKLGFIQPRKPTQNAFVESLNDKFRNACQNQHWFHTLTEAQWEIDQWRQHYNQVRPHSSQGYLPRWNLPGEPLKVDRISSNPWH